jgi:hypothetical protein
MKICDTALFIAEKTHWAGRVEGVGALILPGLRFLGYFSIFLIKI